MVETDLNSKKTNLVTVLNEIIAWGDYRKSQDFTPLGDTELLRPFLTDLINQTETALSKDQLIKLYANYAVTLQKFCNSIVTSAQKFEKEKGPIIDSVESLSLLTHLLFKSFDLIIDYLDFVDYDPKVKKKNLAVYESFMISMDVAMNKLTSLFEYFNPFRDLLEESEYPQDFD